MFSASSAISMLNRWVQNVGRRLSPWHAPSRVMRRNSERKLFVVKSWNAVHAVKRMWVMTAAILIVDRRKLELKTKTNEEQRTCGASL